MANGEIIIEPFVRSGAFVGVYADPVSLNSIEGILASVHTLAERRADPNGVLDDGPALYPSQVYDLRESLMNGRSMAREADDGLGFLGKASATEIARYMGLLVSTPSNLQIVKRRYDMRAHQPEVPPRPSALVEQQVFPLRFIRRRRIVQATRQYEQLAASWLREETRREQQRLEHGLMFDRGLEAAALLGKVVARYAVQAEA